MPENTARSPKRRRILKTLAAILVVLVLLVVTIYFVATSSAFIKRVVLPKIGAAMNATVTADDVSLAPFSQVAIRKLRVQTTGAEPLITADEAVVRYDLFTILGGTIELNEVTLQSPVIQVRQHADGSSNLDPLLKEERKAPSEQEQPPKLSVRNVAIKNGAVRLIKTEKDNSTQTTELSGLNLNITQIQNNQSGKLDIASVLKLENQFLISSAATNSLAQGKLNGTFEFTLDQQLLPKNLQGKATVDLTHGTGTFADLVGLTAALEADLTPTAINQLALRFERAGQRLGQVVAKGPVDLNKSEAQLQVAIQSIDRKVLNLVGASHGWDFRDSKLDSTNQIDITNSGARIAASGRVTGSDISIQQKAQTTPTLNVELDYKTSIDFDQQTVLFERVALTGRQQSKDLIRASLDRPMSLAWGTVGAGLPDATLQLNVSQLDLKEWQPVIGTNLPTGKLDLKLIFQTGLQGKQLSTELTAEIRELEAQFGTNAIQKANLRIAANGQLTELRHLNMPSFKAEILQGQTSIATATGSIRGDISIPSATVQTEADVALPNLLAHFPVPGITANRGALKIKATLDHQRDTQNVSGSAQLANLSGQLDAYKFQDFQTALDYQIQLAPGRIQIERLQAQVQQGNQAGGTLFLSGTLNPTNQAAQLSFAATNVNQHALGPFLAPSLGDTKLVSINLNGSGTANYDPSGDGQLKAQFAVSNWLLQDPQKPLPAAPTAADLKLDGSLRQNLAELKQCELAIRQGNQPSGNLNVTGKFNLTNQAAQVSFTADGLNEQILGPILTPSLGDKKLVSISVSGQGNAGYDPNGESALKAEAKIANFVVTGPQQTTKPTPLSAELHLDGAVRRQLLDLRQLQLALAPTLRAKNQMTVQGQLDFAQTNPTPSKLTVKADSLDLTAYYEVFASGTTTNSSTPPTASRPPAASAPPGEPAPIELPLQELTADLQINQLYLKEIAVTNLQASATINRGQVTLKPFQLSLNGAPVNVTGTVNLSVPGYQYDLAVHADKVPLEPLVNSFMTNSAGAYKGDLVARGQLKGAGVTGASLQNNLGGNLDLSLTNLNLEIVGPKVRRLLDPVALALRLPELTQTPINWVNARTQIGQGRVDLNDFSVLSQAFFAQGKGTVRIAEVLTNSPLDIPVTIALRRSLAEKARLVGPNTPTNMVYVTLPSFASIKGTLGDPKTDINERGVAALLLQTAGNIPQVGGDAGKILQGLGGILSGQRPAIGPTNAPPRGTNAPPGINTTNKPSTNPPPKINPFDLLRNLPLKK